jgi:AmiR/NasT family two-component response regulator
MLSGLSDATLGYSSVYVLKAHQQVKATILSVVAFANDSSVDKVVHSEQENYIVDEINANDVDNNEMTYDIDSTSSVALDR